MRHGDSEYALPATTAEPPRYRLLGVHVMGTTVGHPD